MNECKEALETVLEDTPTAIHFLEAFGAAVACDWGRSEEVAGGDPQVVRDLLHRFLHEPIGPKVEMRRWFSFYDAGASVNQHWHALLLGLVAAYAVEGVDAWKLAATLVPAATKGPDGRPDNYRFKHQCLLVLMDDLNQRVLRSTLTIFKTLRNHQKAYVAHCADTHRCLQHLLLWSDPDGWKSKILVPTMETSLCLGSTWDWLGFAKGFERTPCPLEGHPEKDELNEDQECLLLHFRQTMAALSQISKVAVVSGSPPWSFVLVLSENPDLRLWALGQMKKVWDLVVFLEASKDSYHAALLEHLHVTRWAVFREPLLLFEAAGWRLVGPSARIAIQYLTKVFSGVMNTMGLENTFNDMRDCETRMARHKGRSPQLLSAVSIASLQNRYEGKIPLVAIPDEATGNKRYALKADVFKADSVPDVGVSLEGLVNRKAEPWATASCDQMTSMHLPLFHALLATEERTLWPMLWVSGLVRSGMVLREVASKRTHYVLHGGRWAATTLELQTQDALTEVVVPSLEAVHTCVPITSLSDYQVLSYEVVSEYHSQGVRVGCEIVTADTLLTFVCKHTLPTLTMNILRLLAGHVQPHLKLKKTATFKELCTHIIDACDDTLSDQDREAMIAKIDALVAKRLQQAAARLERAAQAQGPDDQEGEDDEEVP